MAYLISFATQEMCSKHMWLQMLESRVIIMMMIRSLQRLPTWRCSLRCLCAASKDLCLTVQPSVACCQVRTLSDRSAQALTAGILDCQQHAGILSAVKLPS